MTVFEGVCLYFSICGLWVIGGEPIRERPFWWAVEIALIAGWVKSFF